MTTPRDDISGLSAELRLYAKTEMPFPPDDICSKAATQLDSLIKERDALQARVKELEAERDDALGRVDELEQSAEVVSDEFEKDCWKALRILLSECKFDWRNVEPDGVTADDAREYIHDTLNGLESRALRAEQERDSLQARVKGLEQERNVQMLRALRAEQERDEAVSALKPLSRMCEMHVDDEMKDTTGIIFPDSTAVIQVGHLRAARDVVRRLAGPEKEGE